jgi:phage tail protein X
MARKAAAAKLGVMIDALAYGALQTDAGGVVEAALGLNPGLPAALRRSRHALPLDQPVALPEPERGARTVAQIKLWD